MTATAPVRPEAILGDEFGKELDRIRSEIIAARGADDARYIHSVIAARRGMEAHPQPPAPHLDQRRGPRPRPRVRRLPDERRPCLVSAPSRPSRSTTSCSRPSSSGASRCTTWNRMPSPSAASRGVPSWTTCAGFSPRRPASSPRTTWSSRCWPGPPRCPACWATSPPTRCATCGPTLSFFCGHFPGAVQTFTEEHIEGETRGEWYLRQVQGSANIEGGPLFHVLSGNLGHQIEHDASPDLPSNRYAEIAPRVRELCEQYDIPYVTGPLWRQYGSTWGRILRFAVPTG